MEKETITTREEARQKAIDWQDWQSEQPLSYKELSEWHAYFEELAKRFELINEFNENGIL